MCFKRIFAYLPIIMWIKLNRSNAMEVYWKWSIHRTFIIIISSLWTLFQLWCGREIRRNRKWKGTDSNSNSNIHSYTSIELRIKSWNNEAYIETHTVRSLLTIASCIWLCVVKEHFLFASLWFSWFFFCVCVFVLRWFYYLLNFFFATFVWERAWHRNLWIYIR